MNIKIMRNSAGVAALALAVTLPASSAGAANDVPVTRAELQQLQQKVQREADARTLQNMMSKRAFFHGASDQGKELEMFADRADSSFCQNQGCRVGLANIRAAYETRYLEARRAQLPLLAAIEPKIKDSPEWLHVSNFQTHTLTTPILEIADDGRTAKAMWYTPGAIAGLNADTKAYVSEWIWEKYAVDFIKEGGQWKFWHVMVVTDFVVPMGKDLASGIGNAPEGPEGATNVPLLPRQVNAEFYKPLSPTTVPKLFPPLPEPYKSFSQTFSYGPELRTQHPELFK